jgi:hypothetical protein
MESERAPKRPKRERLGGRFFAGDVEDFDDDDLDEELLTGQADESKREDEA